MLKQLDDAICVEDVPATKPGASLPTSQLRGEADRTELLSTRLIHINCTFRLKTWQTIALILYPSAQMIAFIFPLSTDLHLNGDNLVVLCFHLFHFRLFHFHFLFCPRKRGLMRGASFQDRGD